MRRSKGLPSGAWPVFLSAVLLLLVAGTASAQIDHLIAVKGANPDQDVELIWDPAGIYAFEVIRADMADPGNPVAIGWQCDPNLTFNDAGALPAGENYFYDVGEWATPVMADAGPDVDSGNPIGGSPAAADGIGPFTYAWTPVDGLDDPTLPNPTADPAADTEYTLTVTDEGAPGCEATDTVLVTVVTTTPTGACCDDMTGDCDVLTQADCESTIGFTYQGDDTPCDPNPCTPAGPTIDAGPDLDTLCSYPGVIQIPAVTSGGQPPYTWAWDPIGGLDDPTLEQPTVLRPLDPVTYTVTVTDSNMMQGVDTITITPYPECQDTGDCAPGFTLPDQDCNDYTFQNTDTTCKVVMLEFGDPIG